MKRIIQNQALSAVAGGLLIIVSSGCGHDNVKVYHVEANDSATPPPAASAAMPAMMPGGLTAPDNSGLPSLKYTVPAGWQEKKASEMRVASFGVSENGKTADVSVIPLAGMAGGDLANVDRWRGQVGLPKLADDDLQKLAEKVEVAGQPADLFDLPGTAADAQRILGVIFHQGDMSWFFKVTGDSDLVEKQKTAFVAFLKSVQFGVLAASSAPAAMDMSQLPPSHPAIPGMTAPVTTVIGDKPTWTVPAGWQTAPLEQFLVAKYVIVGANGAEAAVNVSPFSGTGGGLLQNVIRWRGQLGLGPVDNAGLAKIVSTLEVSGGQASVVDITGTDASTGKPARLVGVDLPLKGQTWFYKLMGDPDLVAQQKDAFVKFVQSAKYPDAH
ncbi:MAG TPA: hypothetical protein VIK53_08255 [Verrucomicrobiae bacterium]